MSLIEFILWFLLTMLIVSALGTALGLGVVALFRWLFGGRLF